MNAKEKIAQLEAELKAVKKAARIQREPVAGIGGAIQRLRQTKGISVSELGAWSGIGKGSASRIETTPNANPSLETIICIARGLEVHVSEILTEANIL